MDSLIELALSEVGAPHREISAEPVRSKHTDCNHEEIIKQTTATMICQRTYYNPISRTMTSIISTKLSEPPSFAPGVEVLAMMRNSHRISDMVQQQQQPQTAANDDVDMVPSSDSVPLADQSHFNSSKSIHKKEDTKKQEVTPEDPIEATPRKPGASDHRERDNSELRLLGEDYEINSQDVMCGRGKGTLYNNGNKIFRQIIASFLNRFLACKKRVDKQACIAEIIDIVRSSGGHFLKRDGKSLKWHDIGDKAAAAKIGHSLRDLKSEELRRFQEPSDEPKKKKRVYKQVKNAIKEGRWREHDILAARSMQMMALSSPRFHK